MTDVPFMTWTLDEGADSGTGPWRATAPDGFKWTVERFRGRYVLGTGDGDVAATGRKFADMAAVAEYRNESRA